jgi:hypothetical protein
MDGCVAQDIKGIQYLTVCWMQSLSDDWFWLQLLLDLALVWLRVCDPFIWWSLVLRSVAITISALSWTSLHLLFILDNILPHNHSLWSHCCGDHWVCVCGGGVNGVNTVHHNDYQSFSPLLWRLQWLGRHPTPHQTSTYVSCHPWCGAITTWTITVLMVRWCLLAHHLVCTGSLSEHWYDCEIVWLCECITGCMAVWLVLCVLCVWLQISCCSLSERSVDV